MRKAIVVCPRRIGHGGEHREHQNIDQEETRKRRGDASANVGGDGEQPQPFPQDDALFFRDWNADSFISGFYSII